MLLGSTELQVINLSSDCVIPVDLLFPSPTCSLHLCLPSLMVMFVFLCVFVEDVPF